MRSTPTSRPGPVPRVPRTDDDGEAESDRLAHGESKAPAHQTWTQQTAAQLPAPAAEPQVPAAPADLKIPEPVSVPAEFT